MLTMILEFSRIISRVILVAVGCGYLLVWLLFGTVVIFEFLFLVGIWYFFVRLLVPNGEPLLFVFIYFSDMGVGVFFWVLVYMYWSSCLFFVTLFLSILLVQERVEKDIRSRLVVILIFCSTFILFIFVCIIEGYIFLGINIGFVIKGNIMLIHLF